MNPRPNSQIDADCRQACAATSAPEDLNRECFCVSLDRDKLHARLENELGAHGLPLSLADSHPHLFSALPVYVSRRHIEQTARVVSALEAVVALPAYQQAVLAWAPEIARFDPGSPGGLLGLDFHLGPDGARLIEINTNPGGVLLNALLGQAQRLCMPALTQTPTDVAQVESAVSRAMLGEWHQQRGDAATGLIAIVDESPTTQYLYPEFLLFRELFRRQGYSAEICAPEQLLARDNRLYLGDLPVAFVYNRLTDFALQQPASAPLRKAYLEGGVVLSPHPRAHALYADKRNLSVLGDRGFLQASGAAPDTVQVLTEAIPLTRLLTPANRDEMWADRRHLFFKPAAGFGSKASYRGDKLTRRVWDEIAGGPYVAQTIVAPSERHLSAAADPFKVDIRCYAYRGEVLLYAARVYQGQTTNFRTSGGGFAPVLTSRQEPAPP